MNTQEVVAYTSVPGIAGAEWRIHSEEGGKFLIEYIDAKGASVEHILAKNVYRSISAAKTDIETVDQETLNDKNLPKEALTDRVTRLSLTDISEKRMTRLQQAHDVGVSDETFAQLAKTSRVGSTDGIILPGGRYHHCSRAKGWARLGRGDSVQWGESRQAGWRVTTPGTWIVHSSDGFNRNDRESFTVEKIQVGQESWFIVE